jgi:hypothetical protein
MSSIESAPATIPATSDATFTTGFAPPSASTCRCSPTSRCRPARSANPMIGASPPHDTRVGSSNSADRPWHTLTADGFLLGQL